MFGLTAMDMRPGATRYLTSQMGCEDQLDGREQQLAQAAMRGDATAYYQTAQEHGESPGRWRGRAAELLGFSAGETVTKEDVEAVLGRLEDPRTGEQLGSKPRRFRTREQRFAEALEKNPNLTHEQRREVWNEVTDNARSACGFYDATFSAPKSVSVYWSALQATGQQRLADEVHRAHREALAAAMDHLEAQATWTRVGEHRQVPGGTTSGDFEQVDRLIAVEFDHSTSRAEDPHLHTHTAVSNRVPCKDGSWRAIHGAAWRTSKAQVASVYERELAQRIEERTPARFITREDGLGREIAGVSAEAMESSSQRTRQVESEQARAVAEWRETYGRAPTDRERRRIHRQAGLTSRDAKSGRSPQEQLSQWAERVDSSEIARDVAAVGRDIDQYGRPDADALPDPLDRHAVARAALIEVQARGATFNRGELAAEIERQLGMDVPGIDDVHAYIEAVTSEVTTAGNGYDVVSIARPEPVPVPEWWRDETGRPVWRDPAIGRYTTRAQMSTEQDLVVTARQHTQRPLSSAELADISDQLTARGLDESQRHAVLGVLGSPRSADALVSAAGTGKSFVVGQLSEQWEQRTGGAVLGLATSQIASDVLTGEGLDALNTTKFLQQYERDPNTGVPARRLGHRDLLVIDESNMSSTAELARIQRIATDSGAKMLYTGDPQQLQAVGAGGALGLIANENGAYELSEVRRFTEQWEREASLRLRQGQVDALADYERRGRIRGGEREEMREQAVRGYLADTVQGKSSLLITATNTEAADVAAQVQNERARMDHLGAELPHTLGDSNSVHVGDLIQTRRNNRHMRTDGDLHQVTNRERYEVVAGDEDQLLVRRTDGTGQAWLPADYVAEYTVLGYAGTEHSAEGMTVDTGHALHPGYVAMTRGRQRNTAYMTTYEAADEHGPALDTTPREVLAAALSRSELERTAVEQYRAELAASESTQTTLAIWDRVNRELADYRHADAISHQLGLDASDRIDMEDGKTGLFASLRQAELYGQDAEVLLDTAVHERSLERVDDLAAVLRWRVDQHIPARANPQSWSERTVDVAGPLGEFQREVAGLVDSRQRELGRQAADAEPEWAVQALGTAPETVEQRAEWERRAGAIGAYRELRGMPDDRLSLGSRPVDQLERLSYDQAAEASGLDVTALDYSTADDAQLQSWVAHADRAAAWAPEYVNDELGQAREIRYRRESEVVLLQQRAAVAEPDEAERLQAEAQRSQQLSERLAEREQTLEQLHQVRQDWLATTAEVRQRGEEAQQELVRRHPGEGEQDEQQEPEQTTDLPRSMFTVEELAPEATVEERQDLAATADTNAAADLESRHQAWLAEIDSARAVGTEAEHETGRDQQVENEHQAEREDQADNEHTQPEQTDQQEPEQESLFERADLREGNEHVLAQSEPVRVETAELESSSEPVQAADTAETVREATTKARYATDMLTRHRAEQAQQDQAATVEREQATERVAEQGQAVEVDEPQLSL